MRRHSFAWAPQPMLAENGKNILFENNKIAMDTEGSWMIREFYDHEGHEDYAWAMLPYEDVNGNGQCDEGERVSIYNGLGWAASADVKDPQAACVFDESLYTDLETGRRTRAGMLEVPAGGYRWLHTRMK